MKEQQIDEAQAERDRMIAIVTWLAQWPNHCKKCYGAGQFISRFDPSPRGASLSAGTMEDAEPCECTDEGKCPRCGAAVWTADSIEGPCPLCGWNWGENNGDVCPPPYEWVMPDEDAKDLTRQKKIIVVSCQTAMYASHVGRIGTVIYVEERSHIHIVKFADGSQGIFYQEEVQEVTPRMLLAHEDAGIAGLDGITEEMYLYLVSLFQKVNEELLGLNRLGVFTYRQYTDVANLLVEARERLSVMLQQKAEEQQ